LETGKIRRSGPPDPTRTALRGVGPPTRVLAAMVRAGTFRDALYSRLNVGAISLPPLRERVDDIEPLTHHFIRIFSEKLGRNVSGPAPSVLEIFARYAWPGNVRELANVIERAMVVSKGSTILPENLPPHLFEPRPITTGH